MSEYLTLTEFLENTGAQLRFYDVGRRVAAIGRDDFLEFEQTRIPYPYPMQQKAWFALVQQRPQDLSAPLIWFLRFDLDEQGKLVQATRDYFIHRFVELASEKPDAADLGKALDDNPYTFKPRDDKMANLHAILHRDLGLPPSQYFDHARDYFAGKLGWEQWKFLAYQGIADLAARLHETPIGPLLADAVAQLPDEPLIALCQCLENHHLPDSLADALVQRLQQALQAQQPAPALLAALVRGLAQSHASVRDAQVEQVLQHSAANDPEVLAAIGGRAWEALLNPATASAYLQCLAGEAVGQDVFNHCLADLLRMPGLQQPLLDVIRSPQRPDALAKAFQRMLSAD